MKTKVRTHLRKTKKRAIIVRYHGREIKVPQHLTNVKKFTGKEYLATGEDAKGRTQYVYPEEHKEKTSGKKYRRIDRLVSAKGNIISKVTTDAKEGNVEAQAVYTMYKTGFRPGSNIDTKAEKKAFGAITLLKKHVTVKQGNTVKFDFIGKKGVHIKKEVKDPLLANVVKQRKADPRLFETSPDNVRTYFDKKTGGKFVLKDLRTLKAFEVADKALDKTKGLEPKVRKKKVIEMVSSELGNTPGIAAKAYIEPKIERFKK